MRIIRAGAVAAVAGVLGTAGTAVAAGDELRCRLDARVQLSEGLRLGLPLQAGTLSSPEPGTAVCSGAVGGHAFTDAPGSVTLSGTFGDGPISDPAGDGSGGATCTHNDGYISAHLKIELPRGKLMLKARDAYWVRSAMAVIKGHGTIGAAPMALAGVINYRDGTCIDPAKPIHVAGFTMELVSRGEAMTHRFRKARRR